ncbi:MAG: hypothetical protein HW389_2856 [Bacteroidetes bacterium]|nr:hypothetical protein [Bacteroidota bacterium]
MVHGWRKKRGKSLCQRLSDERVDVFELIRIDTELVQYPELSAGNVAFGVNQRTVEVEDDVRDNLLHGKYRMREWWKVNSKQ